MNKPTDLDNNSEIFYRIGQAKEFIKKQPVYYSPEGFFWIWNFERYCYEMKDEVDVLNEIRKGLKVDTISSNSRNEILTAIKQVARMCKPQPKPLGWLQFNKVLIDPKTMIQHEATPEYFLTNPLPYNFGETEEIPTIEKFLKEWVIKDGLQDETYVTSLLECVAYAITDDLFMQRIFALTGAGCNGKGTFLELIRNLVGIENCVSVDMKKLGTNNFAMSAVYKKLVAFCGEVNYDDIKRTSIIKQATGEDLIEFEFKGKNSFSERSITTFIIATNSLPTTPDKSSGFYRRWQIIDFPNTFEIKPNLLHGIPDLEYSNLCKKCVSTLHRLYKEPVFTNEGKIADRESRYEERSNPLPKFMDEMCEESLGNIIPLQEFAIKFNEWLKARRLRILSTRQIGSILRNEGYEIGKRKKEDMSSCAALLRYKFKTDTETTKNNVFQVSNTLNMFNPTLSSFGSNSSSLKTIIHLRCIDCGQEPSHFFTIKGGNPICENCAKASEIKVREPEADEI